MKGILCFFLVVPFFFLSEKEKIFVGSTPANSVVRNFLGISLTDSIDFIRWKLVLYDGRYRLQCNYGVGKPNTNGFINGGKKLEWKGTFSKRENIYQLHHHTSIVDLIELNGDLLHFVNSDQRLLVGNGGWSYTLNNVLPTHANARRVATTSSVIKDSIVFEGRTPCGVPGIIPAGKECYKLKWLVVFYPESGHNEKGKYRLLGTGWRAEGGLRGSWTSAKDKNGGIVYQLKDEKGATFIHLLKLDERVLIFTDTDGKLLVGNEDFSYTLNRRH